MRYRAWIRYCLIVVSVIALDLAAARVWSADPATTQGLIDRHAGYYYPPPPFIEIYKARAVTLTEANRLNRIGFIINIVTNMRRRPYPPTFDIFAKGTEAQKLIIVSTQTGKLDTIYRVRALLATMTSLARATPNFQDYDVKTTFTFLDLLKMIGFTKLTVSDGDTFTHQIKLE